MNQLMLMCRIAGRRAAIPACEVRSVIEIEAITAIPGTPPHIAGLTALRSQALTVIDCRIALGFESAGDPVGSRAAVVAHDGHLYALVVDEAFDVAEVRGDPVDVPGGFGPGWAHAAIGMVEALGGPTLVIAIPALVEGRPAAAA